MRRAYVTTSHSGGCHFSHESLKIKNEGIQIGNGIHLSRGRNPNFSAINPKTMSGVANTVVMLAMATAIIMNDYRFNEVSNLMSDNAPTNACVREQTNLMGWHFASAQRTEWNALLNGNTRPSG